MPLSNPVSLILPSWGIVIRSGKIVASNGNKVISETHRSNVHPKEALRSFLSSHKKRFNLTTVLNICMPETMVSFDFVDISTHKKGNLRSYVHANASHLGSVIWDTVVLSSPQHPRFKALVNKVKTKDVDAILESVKSIGLECDALVTASDIMVHIFSQRDAQPPSSGVYILIDLDGDMATFSLFSGPYLLFFRHQRCSRDTIAKDLKATIDFFAQDTPLSQYHIRHIFLTGSSDPEGDLAKQISIEAGIPCSADQFNDFDELLAKACAKTPSLLPQKRSFIPLSQRPKKSNIEIIVVAALIFLTLFAITVATKSYIAKGAREAMETSTALQVSNTALISRYQAIKKAWSYDKELKRRIAYLTPKLAPPLIASFYLELSQIITTNITLKEISLRQSKARLLVLIPSATLTNSFLDYIESLKSISSVTRVSYSVLGKASNGITTVQVICELKTRGENLNGK